MNAPVIFTWTDDGVMKPLPHFAKLCDRQFVCHENYRMEIVQHRSMESHRHFFAALNEAFANLLESQAGRFPTPDHLRRWALIQAGYRNETTYVAVSKAEALRFSAFLRSLDEYAVVTVDGGMVHYCTAKSQSMREMSKKEFQASKTAVLEHIAKLIGVEASALSSNAGRAA